MLAISHMVQYWLFSMNVSIWMLSASIGLPDHGASSREKSPAQNFANCFWHASSVTAPSPCFSGGSDGKESTCNAGNLGSIPGLGRSPGEGHSNPLQYSCLENPCGQRSLAGYSPSGYKELDMTDRLSTAQQPLVENIVSLIYPLIHEIYLLPLDGWGSLWK